VRFVENVTIPERAVVLPGQTLIKTWRVENHGKTDWPENSRLIFLRGDRSMSTEEEFPVPVCKAGQSVEVSAVILTPTQTGRHTAVFRLADSERVPFGPRLWCDVVVPDLSGASIDPVAGGSSPSAPPSSPWPSAPSAPSTAPSTAPSKPTQPTASSPQPTASSPQPTAPWPAKVESSSPMEITSEVKSVYPKLKDTDKPVDKPTEAPKEPAYQGKYAIQMRALASMGFKNEELNMFLLESHNGNVQTVCEHLLQNLR
jgi:hypothetical protein